MDERSSSGLRKAQKHHGQREFFLVPGCGMANHPAICFGWPSSHLARASCQLKVEESIVFDRANGVVGNFDIGDVQFGNASRDPVFAFGADLAGDLFNECAGFFARGFVVEGFGGDFEVLMAFICGSSPCSRGAVGCDALPMN